MIFVLYEAVLDHRPPKLTIREIDRRNDLCKRMNDLCKRMNDLCECMNDLWMTLTYVSVSSGT